MTVSYPSDAGTREPIKVIRDILKSELSLQDSQIMLPNQKWDISLSPGLYVVLDYASAGVAVANNNYADNAMSGMSEVQEVVMHHLVQIDAMSMDESARTRKEEIIMALASNFSKQAQDANNLQIARIPFGFVNLSGLEETTMLNRYSMTIAVTSLYRKVKALTSYYDTFTTAEETING